MMQVQQDKPPYRVPLMSEIITIPPNGLTVCSTFAGCGGSSTGYRMAGFRVLWANEFDANAQECYRANMNPSTIFDGRDIRTVKPEEILAATHMEPGQLDVLDGSPPCQTFSTAGKRQMNDPKSDLFFEYARLLRGLKPRVFVAENVSGLVKGVAKGMFKLILAELKSCGYRVTCRVLDAQWLGVPQSRQRTIFVGVREDLGIEPAHPKPLPYRYSVRDALPWIVSAINDSKGMEGVRDVDVEPLPSVRAGGGGHQLGWRVESETDISRFAIGKEWDKLKEGEQSAKYFSLQRAASDAPSPTIQASHGNLSTAGVTHPTERRKFTIAELKRICAFPDDFILLGSYANQWARLGNSVPPLMMRAIAETVRDRILKPLA